MTRFTDHLGFETDLMLIALDGRVVRRDGYWVGRRPRVPDHVWGNLLVLDRAPDLAEPRSADRWIARFRSEFGPGARHVALGWIQVDDARATAAPYLEHGFEAVNAVTLTTVAPRLHPGAATDVTVRPLKTNGDWRACTALTRHMYDGTRPDPAWDAWLARQVRRHRALTEAGHGMFFGAFAGDTLVGSLGVYVRRDDGLARYQLVVTDRRRRRRGIARRLVAEAGQHALAHLGARRLTIVADRDGPATAIYLDAGFGDGVPTAGAMRRSHRS